MSATRDGEVRVALGQMSLSADKVGNLRRIGTLVEDAARGGASIVVFPEGSIGQAAELGGSLQAIAESLNGPFVTELKHLARSHRISVVAGMYETAVESDRVYNTVVAVDQSGEHIGSYRKIHLFDAFGFRESDTVRGGDEATLCFDLDGLRFGILTCYDIRFPELARLLIDEGAQVLLVPAAWPNGPLKELHWVTLVTARAIENTAYVVAVGAANGMYTGASLVIDPLGVARVRAGESEELAFGDLSLARVLEARARVPSLQHRRIRVDPRLGPTREAATPGRTGAVDSTNF
jgi:deaminated glutathione amidase